MIHLLDLEERFKCEWSIKAFYGVNQQTPNTGLQLPLSSSQLLQCSGCLSQLEADCRQTLTMETTTESPLSSVHDNDLASSFRGQAVFVRHENETLAMTGLQRFRANLRNLFRPPHHARPQDYNKKHDGDAAQDQQSKQYRLAATRKTKKTARQKLFWNWITCWLCSSSTGDANVRIQNRNSTLSKYLHFAFKISFVSLFAVMCVLFFALATMFAGLILLAGALDAECVRAEGGTFGSDGSRFAEAFSLSWTTLSTVGYGSTYPALGYQNNNPSHCLFITMTCLMEAFVGVLYSGFCGAILFGKVVRIQSHAHVIFSDPVVIRYGSGVQDDTEMQGPSEDDKENIHSDNNIVDDDDTPQTFARKKIPLPVLEFRIVNKLFGQPGGEIMDASLTVVANIDARDADSTAHGDLADTDQRWQMESDSNSLQNGWSPTRDDSDDQNSSSFFRGSNHSSGAAAQQRPTMSNPLASIHAALQFRHHRDHQTVDEDPTARLVNKRIFSKMLIEASEHPFFKRVWLVRHVLDESSPILKSSVRRRIWRNGGHWPERLNNFQGIRNSLQFNQILVSLNGVSNVSAASVYAQQIYDYVDINVGYQFVNIMYRDPEGELKVDTDLINDVREQNGGGGEPLLMDDLGL